MLKDNIDRFVSTFLDPYFNFSDKKKFVHDPLWGTIELAPYEVCLLDTPLFQRLRQIHQTGNVFATFPSATHTRYEHTLGVMHLAGRIAETLMRKYSAQKDLIDDRSYQKVRLAALCHDIGHSAFSHTGEECFSQCDDIKELVGDNGEFPDKGAGEVLSYLIITSASFRAFFSKLKEADHTLKVDLDDFAPLIIGRPSDPSKQFEAAIISGPFDADKLDYFPRDGRAAGIEMALDIDRLLHCMELAEYEKDDGSTTQTLVSWMGGYNAIQQLLFARASLFASVYHHHKVRACDCMVKACYARFKEAKLHFRKGSTSDGVQLNSAADFLYITDLDFFAEALNHDPKTEEHQLIHDLLYRRLFKRVLTISSHSIKDLDSNDEQRANYREFLNLRKKPDKLIEFCDTWHKMSGGICSKHSIAIDIPKPPSFKQPGTTLINVSPRRSKTSLKKLSEFIPVDKWVDTYQQYYARSYLFGPEDVTIRSKLVQAAIKLFKEKFDLEFNEYAIPEDLRKHADP